MLETFFEKAGTFFDSEEARLRCFKGQNFNLVSKAFLYGSNVEVEKNGEPCLNQIGAGVATFEGRLRFRDAPEQEEERNELWETRSPYGKLRNLIRAINISTRRQLEFAKFAGSNAT